MRALEPMAWVWTGSEARVWLAGDEGGEAEVSLRCVTEPAPGRGYESNVEVLDIVGDGDGVDAWVAANRDLILEMRADKARKEGVRSWSSLN